MAQGVPWVEVAGLLGVDHGFLVPPPPRVRRRQIFVQEGALWVCFEAKLELGDGLLHPPSLPVGWPKGVSDAAAAAVDPPILACTALVLCYCATTREPIAQAKKAVVGYLKHCNGKVVS